MQPLRQIDSVAVPLGGVNIDTDQILPGRFIQKPRSCNFGDFLFRDLRANADGTPKADFALDQPAYADAGVLVAGRNFGCGSSREHAVWALYDAGFRAVIAPSFGDIFRNNALKNGLLPVQLDDDAVEALLADLRRASGTRVRVDLVRQVAILPGGKEESFTIDPFARHCLLEGIDEIEYTLAQVDRIREFERERG